MAVVIVAFAHAKQVKTLLEGSLLDKSRKITKTPDGVVIPVTDGDVSQCLAGVAFLWKETYFLEKEPPKTPQESLLLKLCAEFHLDAGTLQPHIPCKWERHGDMLLFSAHAFAEPVWEPLKPALWATVAEALGAGRIALKAAICNDDFRTPAVSVVFGESSIVTHVDNGVVYEFDITKNMFAAGNIREKLRVASFKCSGETVVDLYAGIGYFTLPYLVHTNAALVYACEWNPAAVQALRRNLLLNHVSDRCVVLEGDNEITAPCNVADRVNLGLIPSSERGWPVAARALRRSSGGWLHVHDNVTSARGLDEPQCWAERGLVVAAAIRQLLDKGSEGGWTVQVRHVEPVKSYAPRVTHVVFDLECRPAKGP